MYAPSAAPKVNYAWNAPYDPDDSLAGIFRPVTDAAKLFPGYSKASVVAAGQGLYDIGANTWSSISDHASTLWNNPAAEFKRIDDAKFRIGQAVQNTVVYAAQHPIQSVINVGTATGNYLNRLTSDPEVSGRAGANALAFVAGNQLATAAGSLAPEWLVGTSRASRAAEQAAVRAAATAPSSNPLNIVNPHFTPNGRTIVSAVAQEQADAGLQHLGKFLSLEEQLAYAENPAAGSRYLGTAVHKATDEALRTFHPERFDYNTIGPDFFDNVSGQYIELTTPGQVGRHVAKGGAYTNAKYSTYVLP